MPSIFQIKKSAWQTMLETLISDFTIYAPIQKQSTLDYQVLSKEEIPHIVYNSPKPVSPLKIFFLPIKENVVKKAPPGRPTIIIGCPSCDLHAIDILDEIYLNEPFIDTYYKLRRENTILIGMDCHELLPPCHCTSYGIPPCPNKHADILLSAIDDEIIMASNTKKGTQLTNHLQNSSTPSEEILNRLHSTRENIEEESESASDGWVKYVLAGAIAIILIMTIVIFKQIKSSSWQNIYYVIRLNNSFKIKQEV